MRGKKKRIGEERFYPSELFVRRQRLSQSSSNCSPSDFLPTVRSKFRSVLRLHDFTLHLGASAKSTRPFYERTFSVSTFSPGEASSTRYPRRAPIRQGSPGHVNCRDVGETERVATGAMIFPFFRDRSTSGFVLLRFESRWLSRETVYSEDPRFGVTFTGTDIWVTAVSGNAAGQGSWDFMYVRFIC